MKVLVAEPKKRPFLKEINGSLKSMQEIVGGHLEVIYPYKDKIAIVCNEEGKVNKLPFNRTIYDFDGNYIDVIAGTFFMAGLGREDFTDFPESLVGKYCDLLTQPEAFQFEEDCL